MFNNVLEQVIRVIQFCLDFTFNIFDSLGATGFVFGAFACAVVFRLLLLPVLGGSFSASFTETVEHIKEDGQGQAVTGLENSKKGK